MKPKQIIKNVSSAPIPFCDIPRSIINSDSSVESLLIINTIEGSNVKDNTNNSDGRLLPSQSKKLKWEIVK